jgi:hypothetical protein
VTPAPRDVGAGRPALAALEFAFCEEVEAIFRVLDRFGEELSLEQALRVRDLAAEAAVVASRIRQQSERRIAELQREETLLNLERGVVVPHAARREPEVES